MSLVAFKKKSLVQYGSKRSSGSGGYWVTQGPFGKNPLDMHYGDKGFSINGGRSNVGGVGRDMKMSKSGTPYRGVYPVGHGGKFGTYQNSLSDIPVQSVLNANIVNTRGTQHLYIKPSVLSTNGMLHKKYSWAYNGKYPHYWVQPIYTGNMTDTSSQAVYIENVASNATCNLNVNNDETYEDNIKDCKAVSCKKGRVAPYTKKLHEPVSYSQYHLHLKRCVGKENHFPHRVQTGSGCTTEYQVTPTSE
jgi:hypothetical protein